MYLFFHLCNESMGYTKTIPTNIEKHRLTSFPKEKKANHGSYKLACNKIAVGAGSKLHYMMPGPLTNPDLAL